MSQQEQWRLQHYHSQNSTLKPFLRSTSWTTSCPPLLMPALPSRHQAALTVSYYHDYILTRVELPDKKNRIQISRIDVLADIQTVANKPVGLIATINPIPFDKETLLEEATTLLKYFGTIPAYQVTARHPDRENYTVMTLIRQELYNKVSTELHGHMGELILRYVEMHDNIAPQPETTPPNSPGSSTSSSNSAWTETRCTDTPMSDGSQSPNSALAPPASPSTSTEACSDAMQS